MPVTKHRKISEDYQSIEQPILYLDKMHIYSLNRVRSSVRVGLGEYHIQRLFGRWVGISP
ncbi:MAG: hypothetical protein QGM50_06555 [Anaerolineae bacterium]|nr:hypothetical protein [Anaerolineae bacterium]MDK1118439.1 hypothetical protein [Anaerolineae bacterium]